jgi:hypothetical protein
VRLVIADTGILERFQEHLKWHDEQSEKTITAIGTLDATLEKWMWPPV